MEASGVTSEGSNEGELRTMSAENMNEKKAFYSGFITGVHLDFMSQQGCGSHLTQANLGFIVIDYGFQFLALFSGEIFLELQNIETGGQSHLKFFLFGV